VRPTATPNNGSAPLVSVVMPVYNGQLHLARSVESVLRQSFSDFELLIIDDGSTDGSRDIIDRYRAGDSRITLIRQPHSGLIVALNRGCEVARGRYIARLDSDDIAIQNRFELQFHHMERHPEIVLLGGGFECIDADGLVLFVMSWPGRNDGLHDYLLLDCYIAHTTIMFRREFFLTIGGYRPHFQDAEDYDLFLRMSDRRTVDNLPEVICQYRLHDQQISAKKIGQQIVSGIGARLATRARRANRPEPVWSAMPVSRDDLIHCGVTASRIDALILEYRSSQARYSEGWRWSKTNFCEIVSPKTGSHAE
jgi:glycosyltransferase involved in cell wall biosynthesis